MDFVLSYTTVFLMNNPGLIKEIKIIGGIKPWI